MSKSDKPDTETAPPGPLFARLDKARGGKAAFAKRMQIDHGRLSNWRRRGVPYAQLKRITADIGMTVDEYLAEAGVVQTAAKASNHITPQSAKLLEDFQSLPEWLKEHVAWKTAELRRYADALPPFVKRGMKGPPKDPEKHRAWEREIEADMEKLRSAAIREK